MQSGRLTPSEREIAQLVACGCTNADIACGRGTSPRTVANQLATLYRKVGVASRAELVCALRSQWSEEEMRAPGEDAWRLLSPDERLTLERVACGVASKVVAIELGLAESTVASRLRRCARKVGVGSRIVLLRAWWRRLATLDDEAA